MTETRHLKRAMEETMMAPRQYFVQLGDGKAHGPIVEKTLRRLAARGKLTANDRVARSKDGPWHAVPPMRDGIALDVERRSGDAARPT